MRIRESWARATGQLAQMGILDASIEAEVLLRHATSLERAGFFAALHDQLAPHHQEMVERSIQRRLGGEPLAYITGHREFYGLDFDVSPSVLIPRQETELLVDKVLEFFKQRLPIDKLGAGRRCSQYTPERHAVIADVGTGSGAIAVAIARHLARATIYAIDSDHEALLVADINRRRHAVWRRVHLLQGNLLEPLRQPVDLIVANLPYLRTDEIASLPPEVRREPPHALDGGSDGLDITKRLLHQAPSYIRPGGALLVEIAPQQLGVVWHTAMEAFHTAHVTFARDLLGLPRVVSIDTRSRSHGCLLAPYIQDSFSHTPDPRSVRSCPAWEERIGCASCSTLPRFHEKDTAHVAPHLGRLRAYRQKVGYNIRCFSLDTSKRPVRA